MWHSSGPPFRAIPKCIFQRHCQYSQWTNMSYMETTHLFLSGFSGELVNRVNAILSVPDTWSGANDLLLNTRKIKAVFVCPFSKKVILNHSLKLNNFVIEVVNNFKSLGVLWWVPWDVLTTLSTLHHQLIYRNPMFQSNLNISYLVWATMPKPNFNVLLGV